MLPARTHVTGSGVPAGLLGEVLESLDQLLDPVLVGEEGGGARHLAAEQPVQHRIEEEHRVRAERPVWPRGLQEVDRGRGQSAELDLARDLLDHLVALLVTQGAGVAHGRMDLPAADTIRERDQRTSVRVSRGTDAAWYTRGRRAARLVTTSQEFVPRAAATSAALICSSPCRPSRMNSSCTLTGGPATSVTSAMTASMATLPTSGTRCPRTRTSARFERARDQPSP